MSTTYYHGTSVRLSPGDVLLPGDDLGKTNFGRSEHVYVLESKVGTEHYALTLELARQWAAYAADIQGCGDGDECEILRSGMAHEDAEYQGELFDAKCLFVYRVEPLGDISVDDADDLRSGERARRVARARVVERMVVDW